jgi:hypothetical protein
LTAAKGTLVNVSQTFPLPGMAPSANRDQLATYSPQCGDLGRKVEGVAPQRLPRTVTLRQCVGELHTVLADEVRHVFEPSHATHRIALYGGHFGAPLLVISPQRRLEVIVGVQVRGQCDRISDSQLGTGTYREVCGVRGVAYEHDIISVPNVVSDNLEVVPGQLLIDASQLIYQ